MKIKEYKGFEIEYSEGYEEGFTIAKSDIKKQKLSEIEKHIDGIKRKEFNRFKAIKIDYSDRIEEVEVTSHDDKNYVWVVDAKKRREKIDVCNLLKINEDNLKKIKEMEKLKEEGESLREKKNSISKSLERLKVNEFVKSEDKN